MLRYYSYYSIGGYKDLYLGSNEDMDAERFYLPLLSVLKTDQDSASAKQYEELDALPKIHQLSDKDSYGLPASASSLFSHGGYKLIYRHIQGSVHALALRDINCRTKDEVGRSIPFLMVITGDTAEDVRKLDVITAFIASNIEYSENVIASFIGYDKDRNGLCFKLADFNIWLDSILRENCSFKVATVNGVVRINGSVGKVAILVLPYGINVSYATSEQNLWRLDVKSFDMKDIICKTDTERLLNQLEKLTEELNQTKASYSTMKKIAIAACVACFLLGLLF